MQQNLFNLGPYGVSSPAPDICSGKHGGAETSAEAFNAIAPSIATAQAAALAWLLSRGRYGGTTKEYAAEVGKGLNEVSGRFSELKRDGLAVKTTGRRDGSAVVVAREFA